MPASKAEEFEDSNPNESGGRENANISMLDCSKIYRGKIQLRENENCNEDDSETFSINSVSQTDINLQSSSSNFARNFINNTRRRMSSGLVLSYNFLKGTHNNRRDST